MMWWTGYWPMPWVGPLIMVGFIVLCGAVLVWVMCAMTGPSYFPAQKSSLKSF